MPDPINYLVTDVQLKAIADKIRSKTGGTSNIQFVDAFVSEIEKLTDTRDGTAAAGDIRTGKTAYVNKSKITGNLVELGETTYNTSLSDQTITSPKILTGAQIIKAVTTSNIIASNIKKGVVVTVGDANNAGRIKNVTGSYKPPISIITSSNQTFTYSGETKTIESGLWGSVEFKADAPSGYSYPDYVAVSVKPRYTAYMITVEQVLESNSGIITIKGQVYNERPVAKTLTKDSTTMDFNIYFAYINT